VVEPGRRCLGDRYELQQLIAAGGMGQVWRALDTALHRPVAVKVLRSEYTGDPTFVARFRAEAQNAASLSHPNVAAVFDYGEEPAQDGTGETLAYLVMELVPGEPLSALLRRKGALGVPTMLPLLQQMALALGEAHRMGMVHRDVKPGNILVRPDGSVKITDFGIAWSARSVALTRTGQVIGTPQYLSPEQAEGRLATPASDVYALGLIGYECLTGRPAFEGDNPVTIALKQVSQDPEPLPDAVPSGVRALIGRALVKDPRARVADGAAFAALIQDVLDGRPPVEAPPTVSRAAAVLPAPRAAEPTTVRSPAGRRRGRVAMVLLPLLGLLAGAGIAAAVIAALTADAPDTASAAEQRESGTIVVDAEDYIGQPVDQVAAQLSALGLDVELRADRGTSAVPGRVTGVEPTRGLSSGDTVVVRFAAQVSTTGSPRDGGTAVTGAARGRGTSTAAPTTAAEGPDGAASSATAPSDHTTMPGGRSGTGSSTTATSSSSAPTPTQTSSSPSASSSESSPTSGG
jgi:hypothetical protein